VTTAVRPGPKIEGKFLGLMTFLSPLAPPILVDERDATPLERELASLEVCSRGFTFRELRLLPMTPASCDGTSWRMSPRFAPIFPRRVELDARYEDCKLLPL
jgi:hypothetical protein